MPHSDEDTGRELQHRLTRAWTAHDPAAPPTHLRPTRGPQPPGPRAVAPRLPEAPGAPPGAGPRVRSLTQPVPARRGAAKHALVAAPAPDHEEKGARGHHVRARQAAQE